jgi:hypothetical protein
MVPHVLIPILNYHPVVGVWYHYRCISDVQCPRLDGKKCKIGGTVALSHCFRLKSGTN